jgi:hypothetical protein
MFTMVLNQITQMVSEFSLAFNTRPQQEKFRVSLVYAKLVAQLYRIEKHAFSPLQATQT